MNEPSMSVPSGTEIAPKPTASRRREPRWLAVTIAVALVVGGVVAWVISGRTDSKSPPRAADGSPVGLSADGLRTLAGAVGQPIFWAGPRSGYLYELTKTSKDNVYIRYLPPGVDPGAKGAYLTVATYPFTGALAALQRVAHGKAIRLPGGGIALVDASYGNSVHLAFPGIGYQVEVYDPSPARARALATSGAVQPVH